MQSIYPNETLVPARVMATHKERYVILTETGEKTAVLKSSIFYDTSNHSGLKQTSKTGTKEVKSNPTISSEESMSFEHPTTGDFVLVKPNAAGEDIIYAVYKRKSKFERFDAWNGYEQVVAVNFDYVFIVTSLNKDYNINRMERYISAAWDSGGMPIIVLTKADLCPDFKEQISEVEEMAVGIPIIAASVVSGEGITELAKYFAPGKTSVLLGSSGVGKSSLINAIAGKDAMKISDIRTDDDKGRHTTTHRQLIVLDNYSMIIDTPGMRELGMWETSEGVNAVFAEIDTLISQCRFPNCTHKTEPGCAIKAALKSGGLTQQRLISYNRLKKEAAFSERKERQKKRFESRLDKKKDARDFKAEKKAVKNTLKTWS